VDLDPDSDSDPDADPDLSIFSLTFKMPTKTNLKKVLILIFEGTSTSFFIGKKSKRSHKTVEIKVFLTIFAS
jgi:hypothetical protein